MQTAYHEIERCMHTMCIMQTMYYENNVLCVLCKQRIMETERCMHTMCIMQTMYYANSVLCVLCKQRIMETEHCMHTMCIMQTVARKFANNAALLLAQKAKINMFVQKK